MMADDLDQVTVEALARQPADLSTMQAFRRAFDITMATVSADNWELERTRQRLVFSLPELKVTQFHVYRRVVGELAEADSRRTGRDPDDFELRDLLRGTCRGVDGHHRPLAGFHRTDVPRAGFHRSRYAVRGHRAAIPDDQSAQIYVPVT